MKANVRPESKRPPTPLLTPSTAAGEAAATKNRDAVRGQEDGRLSLAAPHTPDKIRSADTASDRKDEKRDGSGGFDRNRGGGSGSGGGGSGGGVGGGRGDSDPIDRIGSVVLTSLAGSLKIISTAVGGVGDAVFQAGMVAEGLGAGTGRVAGEDGSAAFQRQDVHVVSPWTVHTAAGVFLSGALCSTACFVQVFVRSLAWGIAINKYVFLDGTK